MLFELRLQAKHFLVQLALRMETMIYSPKERTQPRTLNVIFGGVATLRGRTIKYGMTGNQMAQHRSAAPPSAPRLRGPASANTVRSCDRSTR